MLSFKKYIKLRLIDFLNTDCHKKSPSNLKKIFYSTKQQKVYINICRKRLRELKTINYLAKYMKLNIKYINIVNMATLVYKPQDV